MISHQPLSVAFMVYVMLSFIVLPLLGVVQQLVWFFSHDKASGCLVFFIAREGGGRFLLTLSNLTKTSP